MLLVDEPAGVVVYCQRAVIAQTHCINHVLPSERNPDYVYGGFESKGKLLDTAKLIRTVRFRKFSRWEGPSLTENLKRKKSGQKRKPI